MKIISVNTADVGGGAERVAWLLFKGFQAQRMDSWLVVGDRKVRDRRVVRFFLSKHIDYRKYRRLEGKLAAARQRDAAAGLEVFRYPYSKYLPKITGSPPDVILCHNLHGGYFNLRALPRLSRQFPLFVYLHDCWTMTGHCAYPVNCERWRTGCGHCPDLTLPPALVQDASAENWRRKQRVFERTRLHVAAPTRWLLDQVRQSLLAPALIDSRVIPCPVDTAVFRPAVKPLIRKQLELPTDGLLIVGAAHKFRSNPYKDYPALEAAIRRLAVLLPDEKITVVMLGDHGPDLRLGKTQLRFIEFQTPEVVAKYLQAADIFAHAARAENFGLITAEAQACGTPVVATAVGGLSEVVCDGERGLLVPAGDAEHMAQALLRLHKDLTLRHRLGSQAADYARRHWAKEKIVSDCLSWFRERKDISRLPLAG